MEKLTGFCVLLAALSLANSLAVNEDKFFTEGGNLTLDVRPSQKSIQHILWKFNDDLLAEWIKSLVVVDFYRSFKGRSTLDTNDGRLVVNNMSKADKGVYVVEINSNTESVSYTAEWIKPVPQPDAVLKPLVCTSSSDECNVSCDGDTTDAEPITYSWKMGAKDWTPLGKKTIAINDKNAHDKNFMCRMTNPLSEKVSETISNPFYREDEPEPASGVRTGLVVVFSLLALVVVGVGVGVVVWKWKWLCEKFPFLKRCSNTDDTATDKATDLPERSPLNGEEPKPAATDPPERSPLNGEEPKPEPEPKPA